MIPLADWSVTAFSVGSGRVPGHRTRVAEAEVDVLDPVDVDEARSLRLCTNTGKPPGHFAHPVHRHALEERCPRPLRELARARVGLDEPRLLARVQLGASARPTVTDAPRRIASTRAFHEPLGAVDLDDVADRRAHAARAERRVRRDAADGRDLDLHRVAILVGDLHDRADADVLVRVVLDGDRVVEALAQRADPRLEQALLVLRGVVLEVLGEVAELARRLDRLHGRLALRPLELGELGLEGGALLRGQVLGSRFAHETER